MQKLRGTKEDAKERGEDGERASGKSIGKSNADKTHSNKATYHKSSAELKSSTTDLIVCHIE